MKGSFLSVVDRKGSHSTLLNNAKIGVNSHATPKTVMMPIFTQVQSSCCLNRPTVYSLSSVVVKEEKCLWLSQSEICTFIGLSCCSGKKPTASAGIEKLLLFAQIPDQQTKKTE